jgi:hypothetical protein
MFVFSVLTTTTLHQRMANDTTAPFRVFYPRETSHEWAPHTREVFRFGLTPTINVYHIEDYEVELLDCLEIVEMYRKIPSKKIKSAEELVGWAEKNSIEPPPLKELLHCLEAKNQAQLQAHIPYDEQDICRDFLIMYIRSVGELCTLRFEKGMKSSLAIDYLLKEDKEPAETNSDTSLSNDSSANSSFDESL